MRISFLFSPFTSLRRHASLKGNGSRLLILQRWPLNESNDKTGQMLDGRGNGKERDEVGEVGETCARENKKRR